MQDHTLDRLAHEIERHGIESIEADVAIIVDRAVVAGINPVAVAVLADRNQPSIARARAFGLVTTQLLLGRPDSSDRNDRTPIPSEVPAGAPGGAIPCTA